MRVTARVDYAVRSATELALEHPGSLTADTIAGRQGLPLAFTKQILTAMRRAGLVQSQRGGEGGYRLVPPPADVSVADIVRVVEGPLADVRGEAPETLDYPDATVVLRSLWIATRASL
ncbi:MAG TPA: Rrf2 family transcriptional regulator, partial [Acidimicrobiales bacterium]